MAKQAAKKEKPYVNPKFKLGNDNYEVIVKKLRYQGETYTAQEVVKNTDILEVLVDTGYVGIKKV